MTADRTFRFRVYGVPQPGGSKRGFVNPRTGRVVIVEDAKHNKTWRESVREAALTVAPRDLLNVPLILQVTFWMPRPKAHYRTGRFSGVLRDNAPTFHTKKPDATKLLRSTEDALTGILWMDDTLVAHQVVTKRYTEDRPGAEIVIISEPEQALLARSEADKAIDLFQQG